MEAPRISLATRLELNALVDALAADGDSFPPDVARRLIALLPVTPRPSAVQVGASWTAPGGAVEALTSAGSTASAETGGGQAGFTVGSDGAFRVGQWKLAHRPGRVSIGQVMESGPEARMCRLRYDRATGGPIDMQWPRWARIGVGPVAASVMTGWRFWKRPG